MEFKVSLINPPLVYRAGDAYGNIPFMPTGLLYLAGYLEANKVDVSIIDGFGLLPRQCYRIDSTLIGNGLKEEEIIERLNGEKLIGISVHSGMSHSIALRLGQMIKQRYPSSILIAGGSQASVTYKEFLEGGFDYVIIGEGESSLLALVRFLRDGQGSPSEVPGLVWLGSKPTACVFEKDLDRFAFAALHLLPLEEYWNLGMQHAPIQGKFTVITTSRGCAYNCRFCTTPKLLGRKWRTRSAKNIVDEIQNAIEVYGIEDVIIQDELFGLKKQHAQDFAKEILNRGLKIRFYLPSGIKVETTDEETLTLLKHAGLRYMVFAPESGSKRVLEKMNKPMDYEKMFRLVSFASKLEIKLSCVFVLGFEDENNTDRRMTEKMIVKLTKLGVDEISLFIWSPLPGADAFESETGWSRYEDLNWSPNWRKNYIELYRFRRRLHIRWLVTKILYQPLRSLRMILNILTGRYELKSEMALHRILRSYLHRGI
jgi:anaerobic magnesium-protoporphyrin IX monomethyl ester cyclase